MQHNSRTDAKGRVHGAKHNDRNFDVTKSENIDPERVELNEYWHCYQDQSTEMTFEESELKFYEETFGGQLRNTNEAYVRNGHPERCRSMDDWKKVRRNAPEETTFQIGRKYDESGRIVDEFTDAGKLMECFKDYNERIEAWNEKHGRPFTLLSYALHVDESGLAHVQSRRVWHYKTKDGSLKIGQEKALAAAGVGLPDPEKDEGRRNNRKMTFDKMARKMWLDVLQEHGIDVEREAIPDGRKHNQDKEDMIRDKYERILGQTEALTSEKEELENRIEGLQEEAAAQQLKYDENVEVLAAQQRDIEAAVEWMEQIPDWPEYEAEANRAWNALESLRKLMQDIFGSTWVFRNRKAEKGLLSAVEHVRDVIMSSISALRGFEVNNRVPERQQRSKAIANALDEMIEHAESQKELQDVKSILPRRKEQERD